ncbi:YbfB/YjiJ family MFS transporter [Acidisoma sp. 7E03]
MRHPSIPVPADGAARPVFSLPRAVFAAFAANLVGIGLSRFAYAPLLPAIVAAHWFKPSAAAYLGAANLAGYLLGAVCGRRLSARFSAAVCLRGLMLLASLCFFASAVPVSFAWFFVWRFLSGLAGGGLMVLAATTVLPHVPPARRGLLGGVIFMGVGTGIAASGSLLPLLLGLGLVASWTGLGLVSLLLTLLAWSGWPAEGAHRPTAHAAPASAGRRAPGLLPLYVTYGLNAAGWVPHMIFLVAFVAEGLGRGEAVGAAYWVLFGIGATVGPILAGALGDRLGFGPALRLAFAIETAAILLPVLTVAAPALILSSLVVGAFVTGTAPLVLGRLHEILPGTAHRHVAWSEATTAFALFQAAAAYALSFVFARSGGDYRLLFALGAVAMAASLLVDLMQRRRG